MTETVTDNMVVDPNEPPAPVPDGEVEAPCFDPEANVGPIDMERDEATGEWVPRENGESQETRRERLVERAMRRFRDYRDHPIRKDAERRWIREYKLTAAWRMSDNPDEVAFHEIFRQVETMLPQFKGLNLTDWKFAAREPGGEKNAAAATAVVKDMYTRYGSILNERDCKKMMVMHGNAYLVPTQSRFKRTAYKLKPLHGSDEPTEWARITSEVIEEGACLRHVLTADVYTHPKVREAKDSPAVFIREGFSADAMKTQVREAYLDPDATKEAIDAMQGNFQAHEAHQGDPTYDYLSLHGEEELHEYITVWTSDGWEYVICDQKFLLRAQKLANGKIPIVTFTLYPTAGEHYSEGLPTKLAPEQRVINQMMTYSLGQSAFAANPVLMAKRGSSVAREFENLSIVPGTVMVVESMDAAQYLAYPTGTLAVGREMVEFMEAHMKDATGITDRLSGAGPSTGTATLGVSLIKAATERLSYMVDGLVPIYQQIHRWMYNLCARHLNKVYAVRVAGKDGEEFPTHYKPEIFIPDVDALVEIGSATGPDVVNMRANIFKIIAAVPGYDVLKLADWVLKGADDQMRVEDFHQSSPNQQGDALQETQQIMMADGSPSSGFIADPRPSDNHQIHMGIHQMAMQSQAFMMLPPAFQMAMQNHMAIHQAYLQQQMAANAQAQQQEMLQQGGGQGVGGGATAVQQGANRKANAMFGMDQRGAAQNGGQAA